MPDLLCLGEPLLELCEQPDGMYLRGHGGDTSNAAIAAARQGADTGYITHLGDDAFGRSFLDLWREEGVDTAGVRMDAGATTGLCLITYGADGHAFTYYRKDSAASRMTPAGLPDDYLRGAKILHVSGISQAISDSACATVLAAIKTVKEAGGRVSYDSNLRLKLWPLDRAREVIHAAMAQCDIALPGLDDARQLTGRSDPDAIADFYIDLGLQIVALTMGADGTLVAVADGSETRRERIAPYPVEAVDATAAGDTFDGAFLARLLAGDDAFTAARYANAAAALSTLGYGATAPMPHAEKVREFMASKTA